jgi:hypothetical protein
MNCAGGQLVYFTAELRVQGRQALAQGAAETACDQRSRAEAWQPVPVIFLKCDEEIPPVARYGIQGATPARYPRCGVQRKSHLRCRGKIWNIAFTMHSERRGAGAHAWCFLVIGGTYCDRWRSTRAFPRATHQPRTSCTHVTLAPPSGLQPCTWLGKRRPGVNQSLRCHITARLAWRGKSS